MAKTGQEVVYEGWLTKSPPTKRIWRARWRRRWFSLKHSGEIPNQFILTYYADRNCRKCKGFINLDDCEQVDLGLKLDERKLKLDHVFDIKTPTRTYYLAADSESEMKSWVNCICKVCGLKSTSEEDDVVYCEEEGSKPPSGETPPISPVSTSPYIPISECITGKTPMINPQDFKALLEHNRKNSLTKLDFDHTHMNQIYGVSQRNYLNYVNDMQDPRFYDSPRLLSPNQHRNEDADTLHRKDKNHSPLQSPTDTESVFTDDDNADLEVFVTQKFTKVDNGKGKENAVAPPRPPKSISMVSTNYINLNVQSPMSTKTDQEEEAPDPSKKPTTDEMYDFPRSHQMDAEAVRHLVQRRHCYNNAAPAKIDGQIFRYDISPKPSTSSTHVFKYDAEDLQDEPASPLSQTSSTTGYSNLPSPLLTETQLMLPPMVNRDLKPKRKVSESLSSCSNPEPSSPMGAPSVDRKLKPPTPLQDGRKMKTSPHVRKSSVEDDHRFASWNTTPSNFPRKHPNEEVRRIRAAPSPTPPGLGRSHESVLSQNNQEEQIYHYLPGKMQYLDLDLDFASSSMSFNSNTMPSKAANETSTVYKKVDFEKTHAFNVTRNNLEKERCQEPVVTFLKK